jgi:aminoglycoside phosphotransferase (APT) family kinase protein
MNHDLIADPRFREAVTEVVSGVIGSPARIGIGSVQEESLGQQGASGSLVRTFTVRAEHGDGARQMVRVISKEASSLEHHVLSLFSSQHQAIPVTWIETPLQEGRALIVQEYAESYPWQSAPPALTGQTADALAAMHVANLGAPPGWLPRADSSFIDELYLRATQQEWEHNLADPHFAREFGRYTEPLHAALGRLLDTLAELTREQQTLTLINTDITPDHLRLARGKPCIIDWNQAHYGSLYLDLPNVLNVETALLYRDALARHGLDIAPADFLERYREVGRYMGLRYLEVGLLNWRRRGDDGPQQRWFLYYCLTLALRGR